MDAEREEISRERLLLERDRDAFLTYGGELPQMTERHRVLTQEVATLEDRKTYLDKSNAELDAKQKELEAKAARLTGAISELQAQQQTLEGELAQNRAEALKLQPERAALQKEVALLKSQEATLSTSIAQKQKQEATLIASLEGIERQRSHAQTLLSKMTDDRELYDRLGTHIEQISGKFEAILAKSDGLTSEYAAKLEGLDKTLAKMDHGFALLDADRQALGLNLDALKKDHANYAAFLKQNGDQSRALQVQVELLVANNKKFTAVMDAVHGLDAKLQSALAAEVGTLKKMAQDDAQTRANLASATLTLGQNAQLFREQIERTQEAGKNVADLLAKQRTQLESMQTMAADLERAVEKNRQAAQSEIDAGARLGHTAQTLATQADIFKTRLDFADNQGGQLEKLMDNQAGRLKELATMARQLADDINENRRNGDRLRIMLGEIQAMLDKPGKSEDTEPAEATPIGATP